MDVYTLWNKLQTPEQDQELYKQTEPRLRELILGLDDVSEQVSRRTDVYRDVRNANHDFDISTAYAKAGDFPTATIYQSYALIKLHALLEILTIEANRMGGSKLGYGYDTSGEVFEQGGTSGQDEHLWDQANSQKFDHTDPAPANVMVDSEAESDFPELAEAKYDTVHWPARTR
jgi:hypothetical protein